MATPKKRSDGISKTTLVLVIAVTLAIGFIGGTRSKELFGAVAPILGIQVETGTLELESAQTVYQLLSENYDGSLNKDALVSGASRGLVEAVGDKHTVFLDAKEAEEFKKSISGEIGGGIGAEIGVRNDVPTIIRTLEGNPAVKAGVKAGDSIVSVNDEVAKDWDAHDAAMKIRGEPGTTVKLGLKRGDEVKQFSITRAIVDNPSVSSDIKNGIGTLTINRFDDETGKLATKAAKQFKRQGVDKVILDLRGNGGGYVTAAQEVAGLWLKDKVIMIERQGDTVTEKLRSDNEAVLQGVETVVLVNGGSASASEIVAGALKDYNVATLIGEKTFGKGTVQKIIDLAGGGILKVTVARWYTPHGNNISKEGIAPDKKVELTPEQVNAGQDPQMNAARLAF